MEKLIQNLLGPHCDVLIRNGNSKRVSSVVKKRLYKMQDHVHRASQPNMNGVRPMAIRDVHAVQTRQQAKATQDSSIISSSSSKRSNPVDQFKLLTLNDQLNSSQGHVASAMHDRHSPVNNQSVVPQSLTTAPMYDRHSPVNNQSVVPKGVTTAPMYDRHSPVNNQSVVPQSLTTAPMYDRHSPVNNQSVVPKGVTTAPMYHIHSPVNNQSVVSKGVTTASRYDKQPPINIFGLSVSPTYNLPVTCTTNCPTMRLSISDNSLNSDVEDDSQWFITLQREQDLKIQEWDKKMMQDWEERLKKFQQEWEETLKKVQQEWNETVQKERNELIEQLDTELNEEKRKRLVKKKG
ncbi:unnamed protein product [Rotaria sp. Silwood2]|nr:unnamed protein product [Rotaria sp. Silwood2]